jgi:hypothetical protein
MQRPHGPLPPRGFWLLKAVEFQHLLGRKKTVLPVPASHMPRGMAPSPNARNLHMRLRPGYSLLPFMRYSEATRPIRVNPGTRQFLFFEAADQSKSAPTSARTRRNRSPHATRHAWRRRPTHCICVCDFALATPRCSSCGMQRPHGPFASIQAHAGTGATQVLLHLLRGPKPLRPAGSQRGRWIRRAHGGFGSPAARLNPPILFLRRLIKANPHPPRREREEV